MCFHSVCLKCDSDDGGDDDDDDEVFKRGSSTMLMLPVMLSLPSCLPFGERTGISSSVITEDI